MNHDLIRTAQDGLAIADVYVRDCRSYVSEKYDPKFDQALAYQHKYALKRISTIDSSGETKNSKLIRFHVVSGIRLLPPELATDNSQDPEVENKIVAEITAEFISEYRVVKPELPQEAIDEFGNYNTMFHIWPYWRELIQNMCARMRLAQIVLPMYTVVRPPKKAEQTPAKANA